jgi:hypothetical protein
MATGLQPEPTIAPTNTTTTPVQGNDETEGSNTHGESNGIGYDGIRNDSMNDSTSRALLDSRTKDKFDLLWRLRKYLVLIGIIAVGVTYNAGLSPPGGFWNKNQDGHIAGDPVLHAEFSQRYEVFFYCNAMAFAASLVLIILLLSKRVTKQVLAPLDAIYYDFGPLQFIGDLCCWKLQGTEVIHLHLGSSVWCFPICWDSYPSIHKDCFNNYKREGEETGNLDSIKVCCG